MTLERFKKLANEQLIGEGDIDNMHVVYATVYRQIIGDNLYKFENWKNEDNKYYINAVLVDREKFVTALKEIKNAYL